MPNGPTPATEVACPDEDVFADFVGGTIDPDLRADLQAHFESCPRCADTLGLIMGAFDDGTGTSLTDVTGGDDEPTHTILDGRFAGRYDIRECVGLGAGGTVYRAWDPELERIVALKVLRGADLKTDGSTSPEAKWTREAKSMAKVVHPNVVAVHDVGVADEHVFIATEFVDGGSLEDWLGQETRSWSEVLAVFMEAGRGLAAIHARGLVHRDFKPHNVMVGHDERPRVTDFGLARLLPELDDLEEQQTAQNFLESVDIAETIATRTRTGMLVGTPAYMSPEQWRGEPADARSDQFSFCVALYQGLWGRRPFGGKSSLELAGRVCSGEVLPVPPSRVPRWLERIVMRGLSVDPSRRFASMDALLMALEDGPRRRSRRWLAAGLTAGFVAVAGLGYALAQFSGDACGTVDARLAAVWNDEMREDVRHRVPSAELGEEVVGNLDEWASEWSQAARSACEDHKIERSMSERQYALTVSCLDRRAAEVEAATSVLRKVDPRRALEILETVGEPESCGDPELLSRVEPTWSDLEARMLSIELAVDIARVDSLRAAGELTEAVALAREVVARAEDNGDNAVKAEALTCLGVTLGIMKQSRESVETLRAAVWAAEASGHVAMAAEAWVEIVEVVGEQEEDYEEAERALERAAAAVYRLGDRHREILLLSSRGLLMSMQGRYEEALAIQTDVLSQARAHFGDGHHQLAGVHGNLAAVLAHLGKLDEALAHARRGLEIYESSISPLHPTVIELLNTVGALQLHLQDIEGARETYDRAIELATKILPEDSPVFATIYSNLAHADLAEKKYDAAIRSYERVLELRIKAHGPTHADVALAMHNLAGAIDDSGDQPTAIEMYRKALGIKLLTEGADHPSTAATYHNLGLLLSNTDGIDEGIDLMEKAREIRDAASVDPFKRASTRFMLARAYDKRGEKAKALDYAEQAAELLRGIAPRRADILEHIEAWIAKRG